MFLLKEFQIKHHQYVQLAPSIVTTQAQCLGKLWLKLSSQMSGAVENEGGNLFSAYGHTSLVNILLPFVNKKLMPMMEVE